MPVPGKPLLPWFVTVCFLAVSSIAVAQTNVVTNPTGNQTVNQPPGTALIVNRLQVVESVPFMTIDELYSSWQTADVVSARARLDLGDEGMLLFGTLTGSGDKVVLANYPAEADFSSLILDNSHGSGGGIDARTGTGAGIGAFTVTDSDNQNRILCASAYTDFAGVSVDCNPYDLFDISNREAFGNGYMHWFADHATVAWDLTTHQHVVSGWNAGISNPANGVISFDTTSDGNGLGKLKAGQITFPDGSVQTSAYPGGSGALTIANPQNAQITIQSTSPSNAAYGAGLNLQSNLNLWSLVNWNSGNGGIYPGSLGVVQSSAGAGVVRQLFDPSGDVYIGVKTGDGSVSTSTLSVLANDNVGVGTTTPSQRLEVNGNIKLTAGSGASIIFPDGTIQSTAFAGANCMASLEGGGYVAQGGDYAESIDVTGEKTEYQPGDVMVIDPANPSHFLKSSEPYSTLVAGIYSTKPGYVGRRQTTDPKLMSAEVPMAMVGIVPTNASTENGPIKVGDLLVTSSRMGFVMKGTDRGKMLGAVVGKAIQALSSGDGKIEVLVTLQ